ncbi:MAG: B12-binding domain-containing radical SAM protein [Nitrospirae bacterium]|nr:B12-binding domain-containing radical SAM protein [Nitrospirota bacterium]
MSIKRISFIEAGAPGLHVFSKYPVARVGTVLLSTILKEKGYEAKAFIEDVSTPEWEFIESSDLVCISTLTSTTIRAYSIGQRYKAKGIPVIMGGAHPTFMPEEALQYSDFVVRGEGELTLPELMSYIDCGAPAIEKIQGLSYRDKTGKFFHNPDRQLLKEEELDSLPVPDFSLVHNWKPSLLYSVSTSRGCPFACKFCSVIHIFGRNYRFKSAGSVLKELKHISSVSKGTRFFVDDNFTANKQRTKELLRAMISEKLTSDWTAQVRTDVAADPELLRLLADAGCHTVHIGFESINPRTLEQYNKKQTLGDIVRSIRLVRDHGIHIHGMFVVGADTDDVDVINRTVDFAMQNGIDTIQLMVLTPLPGTPVFKEMQESGRLLHKDWSKYDAHHAVFRPSLMSAQTLQTETLEGMGRFYSWKYILKHLSRLDLHLAGIGIFGKTTANKMLGQITAYRDKVFSYKPDNTEIHV